MNKPELVRRTGLVASVCVITAAAAGSVYTNYKISFTLRQILCLSPSVVHKRMKDLHINLSVCLSVCLSAGGVHPSVVSSWELSGPGLVSGRAERWAGELLWRRDVRTPSPLLCLTCHGRPVWPVKLCVFKVTLRERWRQLWSAWFDRGHNQFQQWHVFLVG